VGTDENVGLETPLKNEESIVIVMRLRRKYEWLVYSLQGYI